MPAVQVAPLVTQARAQAPLRQISLQHWPLFVQLAPTFKHWVRSLHLFVLGSQLFEQHSALVAQLSALGLQAAHWLFWGLQ